MSSSMQIVNDFGDYPSTFSITMLKVQTSLKSKEFLATLRLALRTILASQ